MTETRVRKIFAGVGIIAAGQVALTLLSFIRNLIVAWLLVPEERSVALALGTYFLTCEACFTVGAERLVIVWPGKEIIRFQNVGHLVFIARGILISTVMLALSPLVSDFMNMSDYTGAFMLVSLAPLVRSFAHLDIFRQQRSMIFSAQVISQVMAMAISTISTFVAFLFLKDHRLIILAVFIHQFVFVLATHFLAEKKYGFFFNKSYAHEYIIFGLPILGSSLLEAFCQHGDKYIVSYAEGMLYFGDYFLAMMFVTVPVVVYEMVQGRIGLPWLSQAAEDPERLREKHRGLLESASFAALTNIVVMGLVGPTLLVLVFGAKNGACAPIVPLLSAIAATRLLRGAVATIALSNRNARLCLQLSAIRVIVSLVIIILGIRYGVYAVVVGAIAGELVAGAHGYLRLRKAFDWDRPSAGILVSCAMIAVVVIGVFLTLQLFEPWINWSVVIVAYALITTLFLTRSDRLHTYFLRFLEAIPGSPASRNKIKGSRD